MIRREDVLMFTVSVFIAVGLWVQVQPLFEPKKEREFEVPFEITNLSPNLVVSRPPSRVRVVASGTAAQLDRLDTRSISAFADLSRASRGSQNLVVQISAPPSLSVALKPRSTTVELDVDRLGRTETDVEFEPTGLPPGGLIFGGATILPDVVTVVGPESLLPKVARVRVLLDLTAVRPGAPLALNTEVLDSENRPLTDLRTEPPTVTVSPAVAAAPTSKRLLIMPDWKGQPAFGYRVSGYEIRPIQVLVRGESRDLAALSTIDTAPIDITGIDKDREFKVRLDLPSGVRSPGVSEVTVTVRVAGAPAEGTNSG